MSDMSDRLRGQLRHLARKSHRNYHNNNNSNSYHSQQHYEKRYGRDFTVANTTSSSTGPGLHYAEDLRADKPEENNAKNNSTSKTKLLEKNKKSRKEERRDGVEQEKTSSMTSNTQPQRGVIPHLSLEEMGGLSKELPIIKELIQLPLRMPHLFSKLGADPPCGVLLHGPPGVGKTKLVHAIAGSLQVPLFFIAAPEIVSGISGDSEAKLRQLFLDAIEAAPSIVFIDEIDVIAGRREDAQRAMESRIVVQLLACMDQVSQAWRRDGKVVCVMGATNRPEALDAALRRADRFDREIALGIPSLDERQGILKVLCSKVNLAADVDFFEIANLTPGYVGADLHLLIKEACILAIQRKYKQILSMSAAAERDRNGKSNDIYCNGSELNDLINPDNNNNDGSSIENEQNCEEEYEEEDNNCNKDGNERRHNHNERVDKSSYRNSSNDGDNVVCNMSNNIIDHEPFYVTLDEFKQAARRVQPSAMREGFTTIPNVSWADVGALEDVREELERSILRPIRAPKLHHRFGLDHPVGVLLYGPPGCGKTLVAKAIANQSGANFISIKGPELLNKFVGESERSVRMVFARGRASAPCVLFFDELDALAPRRGSDRANPSSERVVNQLLTELDGVDGRKDVYVIGATNRPDMIDPAMLRPGRLDKLLYVPLPSTSQRESILRTHARHYPLDPSVNLTTLAQENRLRGFSGADLAALMREAASVALRDVYASCSAEELDEIERDMTGTMATTTSLSTITMAHLEESLCKVKPSVSALDRQRYEQLSREISDSANNGSSDNGNRK